MGIIGIYTVRYSDSKNGIILHRDQGSQYTSKEFTDYCSAHTVARTNCSPTLRIMFCFGTIPSVLTLLTMVLPLGRNAWLDLLGEGVTILIDENTEAGAGGQKKRRYVSEIRVTKF